MSIVQYVEWQTLQNRGPVDPAPDEPVEGILLVGTKPAIHFYGNETRCGEDAISIFPAVHDGKRCFVKREEWCPSEDYSASGTQEFIVSFEEGVKIFLERGVFNFPMPDAREATSDEAEEYDGSNARPHVPSERVLAAREAASKRGPRPPRRAE